MKFVKLIKSSLLNENSLEEPIADNEQTLQNFWSWFNGSKVVDKQGRPLVMYHGSRKDFDEFISGFSGVRGRGNNTEGFFFSPYREAAEGYAGIRYGIGKVYETYIQIKKPYYAKDYIEISTIDRAKIDMLKKQGYDGVIFNPGEKELKSGFYSKLNEEYLVFDPNQIKSISNNTNYSKENNSIYGGKL